MRRRLLPVMLMVVGLLAGLAAGMAFRPVEATAEAGEAGAAAAEDQADAEAHDGDGSAPHDADAKGALIDGHDYVRFSNQFVVPLLQQERVASVVVLGLSLEVKTGLSERVFEVEPKLRDALLRVLFDHANAGGFDADFTDGTALEPLRIALREAAIGVFGPDLTDVLIVEIVRQDT